MADLEGLLERTSRTFALAIPMLPEALRREVTLAYLLFRIADTFEDATRWPRETRSQALATFVDLLAVPDDAARVRAAAEAWVAARPCDHAGYLELLAEAPAVLAAFAALEPAHRDAIAAHTRRTAEGMAGFVARGDAEGRLYLRDEADLRGYCYVVAGIVGEMLTDLFVLDAPTLVPARAPLWADARAFGEGLQLVNILKDADDDARDGRVYLPPAVPRAAVLALARADLRAAARYVATLQAHHAPRGVLAFTAFPVRLARATLDLLERHGPGAKVPRGEVAAMLGRLFDDLAVGAPAVGDE